MSLIPVIGAAQKFNRPRGIPQFVIERSLRFRSSASAYLDRTPSTASNRTTWTWSGWVKLGVLGTNRTLFDAANTDENNDFWFQISSGNTLAIQQTVGGTVSGQISASTTAIFRDPSAWYHIVLSMDTGNATSTNRARFYVNGVQQTAFSSYTVNSVNTWVNNNSAHTIGKQAPPNSGFLDGYLTEINFVDGQALTPSDFGDFNEDTGVWQPKPYEGTYGTNGFYLNFKDNASTSALGTDFSGNGNNWTTNNISLTAGATFDSMIDTPTPFADGGNGRGNYAVLNPAIRPYDITPAEIISNGNLTLTCSSSVVSGSAWGTQLLTTGKWYFEATLTTAGPSNNCVGFSNNTVVAGRGTFSADARTWGWFYQSDGTKTINALNTSYGSTYTTGDVIGIALDIDNLTITFYKNNISQGQLTGLSLASGSAGWLPAVEGFNGTVWNSNFGQRPFTYTPPTGFKALNTQNLPEPVIAKGGEHFNAITYTGNGTPNRLITGVGFQPDFTWVKSRSTTNGHNLFDAVRGAGLGLTSQSSGAEFDNTAFFTAFASDGYQLGQVGGDTNGNGTNYVAWNWKAGGTPAVTNTDGSITSTVSANPTAGFSIVTYTGTGTNATVGHGLGVAVNFIIIKARNASANWMLGGSNIAAVGNGTWSSIMEGLNTTNAINTGASSTFNSTAPTSTVFSVGTEPNTNGSGRTFVAYCFSEVSGYSRFGSYTGNGSANGPFVFCGFRPAFVLIKRTDSSGFFWIIFDNQRVGYNPNNWTLAPNNENTEAQGGNGEIDLLSNGFKCIDSDGGSNASGGTYIFMALAENPFKNALAR
jgi:hypothetical protein